MENTERKFNDGGAAFAAANEMGWQEGISLRDAAALKLLPGFVMEMYHKELPGFDLAPESRQQIAAKLAFEYADAFIRERQKFYDAKEAYDKTDDPF